MNYGIPALLIACSLLYAAEIPLTELPATDQRAFWTWDGSSFPFHNRNLSGGTIRIGKTEFPSGICGHTPFSNIYILNGSAKSFSAEIGVENTDHKKDPIQPGDPPPKVTFQFFADFREVLRKQCSLGAPPFPVHIDLTGVHHFEIRARASGGRTSHRCRTALGNPVFQTENPRELKRILVRESRPLNESPQYPSAPEWKNIAVEKICYGIYTGAYRFQTKTFDLILVPECGGRALWLSRPNGKNLFAPERSFPREKMLVRGGYPCHISGHFIRILPQESLMPDDPVLETAPYSISFPSEGLIFMRSKKSKVHEIIVEHSYRILPDAIKVTTSIFNAAPLTRPLGIWSLLRVNTHNLHSIKVSEKEKSSAILPQTLNPELDIITKGKSHLSTFFKTGENFSIYVNEPENKLKLYRSSDFTELEILGNSTSLASGKSVQLHQVWKIE